MSSQKKQQAISRFFTAKPNSVDKDKPLDVPSSAPSSSVRRAEDHDGDDDEDEPTPVAQKRRSVKRSFLGLQENANGPLSDEPSRKRSRTSLESPVEEDEGEIDDQRRSVNGHASTAAASAHRTSDRTAKYAFSDGVQTERATDEEEDEPTTRRKQKLHQQFVKKLGKPDSIMDIKRRNHLLDEADNEGEDNLDDEDIENEPPSKSKTFGQSKKSAAKKTSKLTPMEKQVLDIKKKHLDTLLAVEVGYKYRFFGEDARIAARELSIVCIPGKMRFDEHPSEAHLDRFALASIPTHRLHVHVKRLVAAGHKVGVVRQLETAALKAAGDNRNAPFVRQLTNVYTKGTYIDNVEDLDTAASGPSGAAPATGHLLCLTETNAKGWGTDERVQLGILAVQPSTGDIIYDDFEDAFMRGEVETRLLHIAPCELLIVGNLSKATEKLVNHLSGSKTNVFGDKIRVERVKKPKTAAADAFNHISKFYEGKVKHAKVVEESNATPILDKVHKLSEHVSICLSSMIEHLTEYGLQHVFDLTKNFQHFSARSHMLLNGNTLNSLEIYRNQTDNTERGSLFWVLDQTRTRFGQRLLRKWVGRPLLHREKLQDRIDAVEELKNNEGSAIVAKLRQLLSKTKIDLEKSLIRIYYGKCTRPELLNVLQTLHRISQEYAHVKSASDSGLSSTLLGESIASIPLILGDVVMYLDRINPDAAREDEKYAFFREEHETEDIQNHKVAINTVEQDLDEHRKEAAEKLRKRDVVYVTVSGIDYLIEVDNTYEKNVPPSWVKISGTKKLSRFHTPEVVKLIRERDQHQEALAAACDDAHRGLLTDISQHYQALRDCVLSLATLDCLLSLAEVASRPNYCKPSFTDETCVMVESGRHPMVEQLLLDSYVPNDISLSSSDIRALLITGPNMGGKSSYVRQVALISIMGQIGSYVPAVEAKLGMLDAIYTRVGAFDNMMAGESTFMVELSETADIMKQATPRSLIILDELGRGTSTHDGVAIAHAVLDYLVRQTQSLLLFITHYQNLSSIASGNTDVAACMRNMHMKFTETAAADETMPEITFLYELGEGVAHRSYGLNVARLANAPDSVIETAGSKSKEMEREMRAAKLTSLGKHLRKAHADGDEEAGDDAEFEDVVTSIEQL
ncbi:MAG: Mismatch repair protein msh3 [Alyxoria varia]|nr:MAG: Mismatch repair protein msh3 [Alyxoria varia]